MDIIPAFLKKHPCYTANKEFTPKGIMISMVGCPQPSAKVFINNWNRDSYHKACPHVLVDANDGKIYQTLPYNVQGQFAEDNLNDQYISVMLCEPAQIKYRGGEHFAIVGDKEKALEAVDRVYHSAVEVCTYLCQKFGFDPTTQIHSPAQGVNNPKDPNAFWRQLCRDDAVPYSMNTLKAHAKYEPVSESAPIDPARVTVGVDLSSSPDMSAVNGEIIKNEVISDEKTDPIPLHNEEDEQAKDETYQVDLSYTPEPAKLIDIQIDVPNLRIRKGPGTGLGCEPIGKYTGVGRFQITEIQNGSGSETGWGKLATGEGWVSMDFVKML